MYQARDYQFLSSSHPRFTNEGTGSEVPEVTRQEVREQDAIQGGLASARCTAPGAQTPPLQQNKMPQGSRPLGAFVLVQPLPQDKEQTAPGPRCSQAPSPVYPFLPSKRSTDLYSRPLEESGVIQPKPDPAPSLVYDRGLGSPQPRALNNKRPQFFLPKASPNCMCSEYADLTHCSSATKYTECLPARTAT